MRDRWRPVAILAGVGPTVLLVIALIKNRAEHLGNISALTLGMILMTAGVVFYYVTEWFRKNLVNG